jgi:transposase-like protein
VSNGAGSSSIYGRFQAGSGAVAVSSGRPLAQIAGELGIAPSMLRNWRRGGRNSGPALPSNTLASAPHCVLDPRQKSLVCAARTIGCGWSATF